MRFVKTALFVFVFVFLAAVPVAYAQDSDGQADFERRMELAEQMQELRPARDQVNTAIDQYVSRLPPDQREQYRAALQNVLNYKALEKISIDAYAETYTVDELEAMVEYFKKPEARSASEKAQKYAEIVYPEIIRMLDKALMQAKTGGLGP